MDSNLASVARNVRVVLATIFTSAFFIFVFSKSVFVVGCHRQADRTTDRLRASVLRFGLLTKDQVRQSLAEKVDYHLDLRVDRRHIQPRSKLNITSRSKGVEPKLRNLALVQFEGFALRMVGEHQGVESVFVVDLACTQDPPAARLRLLILVIVRSRSCWVICWSPLFGW